MHSHPRSILPACRASVVAVMAVVLTGLLPLAVHARDALSKDTPWESVLLRSNWPDEVLRLPAGEDGASASSVPRFIRAHALLARSRNNESLCLFLSASAPADHEEWELWTREFVGKHPASAVARYFRGDALARLQEWDHAIQEFTAGLFVEPDNPLLLNARGVVHALHGNSDAALVDFTRANRASPDLADAYASKGFMWIQKKDAASGALQAFELALARSKDFALAHFGRGCVRAVLGDWKGSAEDLKDAVAKSPCSRDLVGSQLAAMLGKIAAKEREWLEATGGKTPGTEIERKFMDNMSAIRNGSFGGWRGPLNQNIKLMRDNPHLVDTWRKQTRDLSPSINQNLHAAMTVRERDVNNWWSQVKDLTVSVTGGIKKGGVGIEGKIQSSGTNWANHNLKFGDAPTWNKARQLLPPVQSTKPPGGFKSAPVQASWDDGDWPFEAQYGLLYRMEQHSRAYGP